MLLDVGVGGGGGLASVLAVQSLLFFFIKENWTSTMTTYHAESNNILLTSNLPFLSDV